VPLPSGEVIVVSEVMFDDDAFGEHSASAA
jgi:ribonuclease HII